MIFPLVANNKVRLAVENFINENRIPHAIIIEGDEGTGKHTLAKYISNSVVCENVELGNHPDITIIKPEDRKKNIAVSQIRELREEAFIKPHKAQKRVFIIDLAETMNTQSQNALLKVLEEPPKTVMFILIVPNATVLLDTIISRCVVLSLVSPEFSIGLEYIKSISKKDEDAIITALNSAQNNIGKALKLLKGKKGSETEAATKEFLDAMLKADGFLMLSVLSRFEKNRVSAENFIKDLKYIIMQKIKNDINSVYTKPLMAFYGLLTEYEQSLATNINLNLLFCSMTSKATELFGG